MTSLGRPRDPSFNEAAMRAAVALIVDGGYPAVTMARIAERAAVSKAALYRRWPNKVSLVVDAVDAFARTQIQLPDTGSLSDDLVEFLRTFVRNRTANATTFEALGSALTAEPELAAHCRGTLIATFSAAFRTIVDRASARGELAPGTDVDLLADLAPALIRHRRLTTGMPLDEAFIDRIVRQFFAPVTTVAS